MPPRPYILAEANLPQLRHYRPNVAVLPWGATEAHNRHLPHGTDTVEAQTLAERAAAEAADRGARPIVLPPIPFGNNAQQLDQIATISLRTATAAAVLRDVACSLKRQDIDRLVIVNSHGGNEFKPLVRDLQDELGVLIVVVNFWQMLPDRAHEHFAGNPGDHAGRLETAFMLHARPDWVVTHQAGPGDSIPLKLRTLQQPGVWTPRPWSHTQPDTGAGDPTGATAQAGEEYLRDLVAALAALLAELSAATRGDLPYI